MMLCIHDDVVRSFQKYAPPTYAKVVQHTSSRSYEFQTSCALCYIWGYSNVMEGFRAEFIHHPMELICERVRLRYPCFNRDFTWRCFLAFSISLQISHSIAFKRNDCCKQVIIDISCSYLCCTLCFLMEKDK